ncbi:MAG: four helix bundle protein [Ardenticatenales bacterium]|nr:four helix bundle protein [Ardenticatenales bacterium]
MRERPRSFDAWRETVHPSLLHDPLWQFHVYPKALFLYDLAWGDCEYLLKDVRGATIAKQLIRSVGSISANIEEGYGRGFGKDYAFRLRIAVAEARESRGWYWRGHLLLPAQVLTHRLDLLNEIISMLVPNVVSQRKHGE